MPESKTAIQQMVADDDERVLVSIRIRKTVDRMVEKAVVDLDCTKAQYFEDALIDRLSSTKQN